MKNKIGLILLVLISFTLLHCGKEDDFLKAAAKGDIQKVKKFVQTGIDVNIKNKSTGESALIIAIKGNNWDVAKFLIENKADVNAVSKTGEAALILAVNNDDYDLVKLLIAGGASYDVKNKAGSTLYDLLLKKEFVDRVYVMPKGGANLRETSNESSKSLALIPSNKQIMVMDTSDKFETIGGVNSNWWRVYHEGVMGWIFSGFLTYYDTTKEVKIPEYMVIVPGGTFNMGDGTGAGVNENGQNDEKPVHAVTLSSFWISKYEVTQKDWAAIMGNNPASFKGDGFPIETVNWYEAIEYCNRLSKAEGLKECYKIDKSKQDPNIKSDSDNVRWLVTKNQRANGYRLPSEEEWEYAARYPGNPSSFASGSTASVDNAAALNEVAWHEPNSQASTHKVGTKKPNKLGVYDMSGNVWEWCESFLERYPGNVDTFNFFDKGNRAFRGGAWNSDDVNFLRTSNRAGNPGTIKTNQIGLRVVRTAK